MKVADLYNAILASGRAPELPPNLTARPKFETMGCGPQATAYQTKATFSIAR
jgi:hypothetical protein